MSSIHEAFPLKRFGYGWGLLGNYKKALELLDAGADPNELNPHGFNLLHVIGKYRHGVTDEDLLDYLEYMPQVLEKALPLMKDKGVNQQLKSKEEYKSLEDNIYLNWYAGCAPLHLAIGGMDGMAYVHYKAQRDNLHYKIKTMTYGEVDKKCRQYREMFLTKLLVFGADKTITDASGREAYEYAEESLSDASSKKPVKKILDKFR